MLPTIEIHVRAVDHHGNYTTTFGGKILCTRTKTPFLDAARRLVEASHDRSSLLVMFRSGRPCLLGRLGDAAGLTVDETSMRFARWKACSRQTVDPPIRETGSAGPHGHNCGSGRISAEVVS